MLKSKFLAVAVAGVLASGAANAEVPTGDDGGLLGVIFDGSRSIVQYLGTSLTANERADLTTTGFEAITRGPFTFDLTGFSLPVTNFIVVAGDNIFGGGHRVYGTSSIVQPATTLGGGGGVSTIAGQTNNYIIGTFNDPVSPCFGLTSCAGVFGTAEYWAPHGGPLQMAGPIATPMTMWEINRPVVAGPGSGASNATPYAVASAFPGLGPTRVGQWSFSVSGLTGTLNYNFPAEIPLPAAGWLLLSGLLGLGAVRRRRAAA